MHKEFNSYFEAKESAWHFFKSKNEHIRSVNIHHCIEKEEDDVIYVYCTFTPNFGAGISELFHTKFPKK